MGKIATFYSYKGGVGRTFLLANVAVLLARWGRRVLCVDWDLEAPGLLHYFGASAGKTPLPTVRGGVVDVVASVATGERVDWREMVIEIEGAEDWSVDVLPAGAPGADYVRKLHALDWGRLYDEHGLGWVLEELRTQWLADYDLVLIDSRTGLTDIGGICAAQLPDILVVLSSANEQSLTGCLDVIDRAMKARDGMPVPRPGPLVLPLASRFDEREEYDDAAAWLDRFAAEWAASYRAWAPDGTEPRKLLTLLRIPYVSKWSFGEHLPVRRERTDDPGLISWSVANVAACLARGLGQAELLVSNRDAYVRQSDPPDEERVPRHDLYISHSRKDGALVRRLTSGFEARKLRPFLGGHRLTGRETASQIRDDISSSPVFVPLVTENWIRSQWARLELDLALQLKKTIIPLYLGNDAQQSAPLILASYHGFVLDHDVDPSLEETIAEAVDRARQWG